jgi:AraC family transcriptional regulator of adaptative response/methylated-DNA-[protein]-cysteine methyltransferase
MTTATMVEPLNFMAMSSSRDEFWNSVLTRDANQDGKFVFAVSSTGVYCRPSCPAKHPRRQNVTFYRRPEDAEQHGYRACLRCRPKAAAGNPQMQLVKAVSRYIAEHLDEPVTLSHLGKLFRQSPFHLQRTFKAVLGVTPKAYADSCRMNQLKKHLRAGHSVTRAMYDAGYGSSSRLYERTASHLGMTPDKYRRGAIAAAIRYTCAECALGTVLIAATDKGICSIQFGPSEAELEQGLKHEFPFAQRRRDDSGLRAWKDTILQRLRGQKLNSALPLDIQATAFQRRVWEYLQSIPYGSTQSYSRVAQAIGQPKATRAVARACATNPVALAIPCHRVVRENGELGGYRWGMERKQELLKLERGAEP